MLEQRLLYLICMHTMSQLIMQAGTLTWLLAPCHSKYCLKQEYDAAECSSHHFSINTLQSIFSTNLTNFNVIFQYATGKANAI